MRPRRKPGSQWRETMLRLFYSPGACSLVPHVALEEAGAEFEAVRKTIAEKAHKRPEYLAINPRGLIPAIAEVIDDLVLRFAGSNI